ncbi:MULTISPECIES: phosphoribosyl-AMP cyclohydrolase [Gordonia]|uniref:Phosphoribosyl-AMP cyclohydrolase n=2 Tax=Gordonia TaxID=2053 RepID=L7LG31_9ACTN|nr:MULTISPECIES: phosphoribosyl-AMP cyclohydrolase [Gordonia]AUH68814.1 phosphoribosyl-AMP cyclohydrolase [Gordonia sp. YC-JH1]KXT56256.1 phosphoribosyl-AMP cyclohydrolase [Gordonia sp. QH-12]MBY4570545.1 phosphoribosyl-AMP cyclohydrolase [Gordonia sihwensis]WFN91317.1 phosphoribosyl-AMP cyclohydrolase [Gordonia sihwensis]GAC60065.1 phosphoribosyl-AMP cyclohydrolase [Gordonia sihwensis NBRC 108236]
MALPAELAATLKRNDDGLFAAIAQERSTGIVLMMAWMDDEALERTLATRKATYYSRSRGEYWVKGETSGHTQYVHDIRIDCDGDTLLLTVDQTGAACHTGNHSCFDTEPLEFGVPAEPARTDDQER